MSEMMLYRANRFDLRCPHCDKQGVNSKGAGGNNLCFHCGECGFVECEWCSPAHESCVAESPAPLSEPTNCPECKSESKRYSVCISHKNAKECRYAGSPCVLCRNSWHESHSLPEPPTGLLQGHIEAAPLSEEEPARITEFGLVRESDGWYFDTPVFSQHESLKKLVEAYLRLRGAAFSEEAARREPTHDEILAILKDHFGSKPPDEWSLSDWADLIVEVHGEWLACAKKRAEG